MCRRVWSVALVTAEDPLSVCHVGPTVRRSCDSGRDVILLYGGSCDVILLYGGSCDVLLYGRSWDSGRDVILLYGGSSDSGRDVILLYGGRCDFMWRHLTVHCSAVTQSASYMQLGSTQFGSRLGFGVLKVHILFCLFLFVSNGVYTSNCTTIWK